MTELSSVLKLSGFLLSKLLYFSEINEIGGFVLVNFCDGPVFGDWRRILPRSKCGIPIRSSRKTLSSRNKCGIQLRMGRAANYTAAMQHQRRRVAPGVQEIEVCVTGVCVTGACMTGVCATGVCVTGAYMTGVCAKGVCVTGACLTGVRVTGVRATGGMDEKST